MAAKVTTKARVTSTPATPKPAPVRTCRFGEGAYGSPADSKRCGKPIFELDKHPGHQLCKTHIPMWNTIAKARAAAAKPATVAKPKSAGTSPKSTPKPKARAAKIGPVTKVPKSIPMLPPIARVVTNSQPGAMMSMLVALDPTEGQDDK